MFQKFKYNMFGHRFLWFLSYLEFTPLCDFVGMCLSPNMLSFHPLFLQTFFQHHIFLSPTDSLMTQILDLLLLFHQTLRFCSFFFFNLFSLCCSDWIIFNNMISGSLFLSPIIFILLLFAVNLYFWLLYFSLLKFFISFSFLSSISVLKFVSKSAHDCSFEHIYKICFKDCQIIPTSVLSHHWHLLIVLSKTIWDFNSSSYFR